MKNDDMISRAAAIEALSTPCDKRYRHGVWETCLDNIETAIRNIPAVDAIPVEWLEAHRTEYFEDWGNEPVTIEQALIMWQKKQEAMA